MIKRVWKKFYRSFLMNTEQKRSLPWFAANGDKTLRLDYDLTNNSIVFDLGGYEGQWASDVFARYCCKIHIFEPVEEFVRNIEKRFSRNNSIVAHHFGLSDETKKSIISVAEYGSSTFKKGERSQEIFFVKAVNFMLEHEITHIDLMKINIEGGEYDLLDHLIETGFINNIDNIQVQFHDFVPDAEQRMRNIQERLQETHHLTYQYPFVWENWRKRT